MNATEGPAMAGPPLDGPKLFREQCYVDANGSVRSRKSRCKKSATAPFWDGATPRRRRDAAVRRSAEARVAGVGARRPQERARRAKWFDLMMANQEDLRRSHRRRGALAEARGEIADGASLASGSGE